MKDFIALAVTLAACSSSSNPPPKTLSPAPRSGADVALTSALAGRARTEVERARDGARHPAETLTFFGLRSDMSVVELCPGLGWYTAILAPYLRERGRLTVAVFGADDPKSEWADEARAIAERFAGDPADFDKVAVQQVSSGNLLLGADESADLVVTFRNVHNWIPEHTASDVFHAAARVLKHGGVLGVEDHRAAHDQTAQQVKDTGYVSEAQVIALAADAGLVLDARSDVNANPRDSKDHPHGVWSLPPTYAGKDIDRARYSAIGESDRMTLRFRKP
jgi:predicted methyltransferase